jgi:hypothetical protein
VKKPDQLEDAGANLKIIQKGIEASASELLRTQVKETLASFEHSMEELRRSIRSEGGGTRSLAD